MCPSSATAQTFQLFLPIGQQINLKITLLLINFISQQENSFGLLVARQTCEAHSASESESL